MLLIATLAMLLFVSQGFGLLGGQAAVRQFNYLALATYFVVGIFACAAVAIDGVSNLRRFAIRGVARPRWWFELARLAWMSLLFLFLLSLFLYFTGIPRLRPVSDWLFRATKSLFLAFLLFGTAAYLVAILTGRRRRGRAFECVQYFYWLFGTISLVTWLSIRVPIQAAWGQPVVIVVCVVVATMFGILGFNISKQSERKRARSRDVIA